MTLSCWEWQLIDKMTFEKNLRSVSIAASQCLGILRKSWQVFHDRLLHERCFRGFILPVLEYCSAVWCAAADTHLKLLDRVVSGGSFLTEVVFWVWPCTSSTCWQYNVCCTRSGVTRCTLFMVLFPCRMFRCGFHAALHRYTYAPPRCRTSQYRRTFIPFSVSLWNDLSDPVFDGVGLAGFNGRANSFLLA